MSELENFQHDLGRELVGAAYRERAKAAELSRPKLRLVPLFGLAALLLIAIVTLIDLPGPLGSGTAVADVFQIATLEDRIELDVVDVITDPNEVAKQLRTELGLDAEVIAVPADPQLVGQISLVGTTGEIAPQLEFNSNGTVESVILPVGFEADLIVEYGRSAAPGEDYTMTVTSPTCAQFFGDTYRATISQVEALASEVRFQLVDAEGLITVDPDPESIPDGFRLVNIEALSDTSILVAYGQNLSARSVHPNCK